MSTFKLQNTAKAFIMWKTLFLSSIALASSSLDFEGPNLVGPKSFITIKVPKPSWEEKKPQGALQKCKGNRVDYFTKLHPELLHQASKNLSGKSFIIQKDINGYCTFEDPRD